MKIVLFDMDGTLIDSQNDITASINYVRDLNHKLPPLSSAYIVEVINQEVRDLPLLFYKTDTYLESDRMLFEAHYDKQCTSEPYLYEGVKELLFHLYENGIKMGVATNAPAPFAKQMIGHLGVDHLFEIIVGADMVANPKPSADMIELNLEHISQGQEYEAWMVGDSSKDMDSAKNAKITSVFATWGFSASGKGDIVISHPQELKKILGV